MTDIPVSPLLLDDYCLKHATKMVEGECVFCKMGLRADLPVRYVPVFVGKTEADEKIVLYKEGNDENSLHIRRDDGELHALSPGAEIRTQFDPDQAVFHIRIDAYSWSVTAKGTKYELLEEPVIR